MFREYLYRYFHGTDAHKRAQCLWRTFSSPLHTDAREIISSGAALPNATKVTPVGSGLVVVLIGWKHRTTEEPQTALENEAFTQSKKILRGHERKHLNPRNAQTHVHTSKVI